MQGKLSDNKRIGGEGEDLAVRHLKGLGFEIKARNVTYKCGEIDIVASKKDELHFVEVKTRTYTSFVPPYEAVTEAKRKRIKKAAQMYLIDGRKNLKKHHIPACYFDVISIGYGNDNNPNVEFIVDAFM